jgi:sugar phosphate isomerase/epimerase
MMHVVRSGGGAADLAALDPDLIGYVQVCDTLLAPDENYGDASANQRMPIGEGEFPILDMLNALPRDGVFGVEAPLRDKALAGVSLYDALAPSVAATRALLAQRRPG